MRSLIVKINVWPKGLQYFTFWHAAKKKRLIYINTPGPECANDPFMRRTVAGRN